METAFPGMAEVLTGGDTRLVVRVTLELAAAVDEAAELAGQSRSAWMRDALTAGATAERAAAVREAEERLVGVSVNGHRRLGLRQRVPAGVCLHPLSAREMKTFAVVCGLCGAVMRRLG